MPKQKSIEIKNLFYDDLEGLLNKAMAKIAREKKIPRSEFKKKIEPKLNEIRSRFEDTVSSSYLKFKKVNLNKFLELHIKNQKSIVQTNEQSFSAFLAYVNASTTVYQRITENIKGRRVNPTLRITLSLYGLVIRRTQEIADLLIGGYIDAAMIIWRSMYENSVTLLILAIQDDKELSKRYVEHSFRHSKRKIKSYDETHQDLGFEPLPKEQHTLLAKKTKRLQAKYGKDFLEGDYCWAESLVKGKVTFRSLEDLAGMGRFRTYYNLCSEHTHSSFNGLNQFFDGGKIILPRITRQEWELEAFIDPMQFTVSILHEVNDYILWQFSPKNEFNANVLLLRKMFEIMQSTFDAKGDSKEKKD